MSRTVWQMSHDIKRLHDLALSSSAIPYPASLTLYHSFIHLSGFAFSQSILCSFYAFSVSINTSVPQGFFSHPLLCWCYALSFYVLIYIQSFNKIPALSSLALKCLLGAISLFISAYYTYTLGHFTYASSSTCLKLNSLFLSVCSFTFVPYLIQGLIFPAGI